MKKDYVYSSRFFFYIIVNLIYKNDELNEPNWHLVYCFHWYWSYQLNAIIYRNVSIYGLISSTCASHITNKQTNDRTTKWIFWFCGHNHFLLGDQLKIHFGFLLCVELFFLFIYFRQLLIIIWLVLSFFFIRFECISMICYKTYDVPLISCYWVASWIPNINNRCGNKRKHFMWFFRIGYLILIQTFT